MTDIPTAQLSHLFLPHPTARRVLHFWRQPNAEPDFAHFRDVPDAVWRLPNFSPAEIACRGTGAIKINTEARHCTYNSIGWHRRLRIATSKLERDTARESEEPAVVGEVTFVEMP